MNMGYGFLRAIYGQKPKKPYAYLKSLYGDQLEKHLKTRRARATANEKLSESELSDFRRKLKNRIQKRERQKFFIAILSIGLTAIAFMAFVWFARIIFL